MQLDARLKLDDKIASSPNLCDRLTERDLQAIGASVYQGYLHDKQSRYKWEMRMSAAMDLAMQISMAKNFPWPGCANVVFPLITIAALQFSARAYPAIIQGTDVVRYRVINPDPAGEMIKRANRIARHMSWQVLEEDESWEEQHDRLLINLAVVGSAFVKTYFSQSLYHNVSELVMARDLVIDYFAKSIEGAARVTHRIPLYRNEIHERIVNDVFVDIRDEAWYRTQPPMYNTLPSQLQADQRAGMGPPVADDESPFSTLEQHRYLDLDGDGYAEPYIVTIEEASTKVLRIVARWESDDDIERNSRKEVVRIRRTEYFTKYSFIPSPDGGIYDLGFGTFLGPINEAVSTAINQLLDAGTLQNSIGGFLGRGVKIRGGVYTMAPWEFKRVDSTGDDIRKNIVQWEKRDPLTVTFQLIGLLVEYANRIAGTTDPMVGENPGQNTPAETSRNTLEQGTQHFSAIFKRVWRSTKIEFQRLFQLNKRNLRTEVTFGSNEDVIRREDYTGNPDQIAPVANPNITSATMRLTQSLLIAGRSTVTPGYDKDEVEKNVLRSAQVENIDKLYPGIEKTGPLPNYHVQVQELKTKEHEITVKSEQMKWANELLITRQKTQAEIDLLKAQAAKVIADIGTEKAAMLIQGFEAIVSALEKRMSLDNDRLQMLLGKQTETPDGKQTETPIPGGIPGLADASSNPGVSPVGPGGQAKPNGAMAGG